MRNVARKYYNSLHEGRSMMASSRETDQSILGGDGQRDERVRHEENYAPHIPSVTRIMIWRS